MSMEAIGTAAGFVFTLLIFSYLPGDNPLYRLTVYIFIGLAAAFTTIVTFESVLIPLVLAAADGTPAPEDALGLISLMAAPFLVLPLLLRRLPGASMALAFLVAVGAAVAVIGAITGTLFPLVQATGTFSRDGLLDGIILFIGVATSLIYFQYLARKTADGRLERGRLSRSLGAIGQGFIVVTLGALYGAAILTSLTILAERTGFLVRGG